MLTVSRRRFILAAALLAPATWARSQEIRVPLADFIELSERLLGRSKLDPDLARIYLDALMADATNAVHLATLVQSNGNPTPEQRVLSQTIIEWWYTGVYEVDGKPRLATDTGALVWSALDMPAPGTCAGAFGAWSTPPRAM